MFLLQERSLIVYQCYPTQANCWHRPGYYQAQEPHYLPSRPVFVGKVQRLVFNLRKRDRMPTSVNIRISSTSFVKVFTAHGSSICFWGFCLPPVTPYMSWPKELTSRRTRWEYSAVISVLPVRRVQRKASSSGGRLSTFSHSSDGFVGHYVSVLFERIASRMYTGQFIVFPWV